MSLYLYGVISHQKPIHFGPIGFEGAAVAAMPMGKIAAVVGSSPMENFCNLPKEALIKLLLSHQQTLETIMARFFALPFKFGTIVQDEAELTWLLERGEPLLWKMLESFRGSAEIDLVATWQVREILQAISEEDPEIIAIKQEMATKNQAQDVSPCYVGRLLAQALSKRAGQWRQRITDLLKVHTLASADHDLLNDAMVMNSSFLIQKENESAFHRVVEEVDRSFQGRLDFKCVGPLPPYSFATIVLKRFDPKEIREAGKVLGFNGKADLSQVKKFYRELSKTAHPDANPSIPPERFEILSKAYELLADYCQEGPRSLEKEAVERYIRLDLVGTQGGLQ